MTDFLVLAALLLPAGTCHAADQAASAPYTIGIFTDLSGPVAFAGEQVVAGAQLAAEELNASGHRIALVISDHRFETKTAVSEAQRLLFRENIDAVFGLGTAACVAASPLFKSREVLFVYDAIARSILDSNPFALKMYLDYQSGCRQIARYWKQHGVVRAGVLHSETEYGELCLRGVREEFDDALVLSYALNDDLSSRTAIMKSKGAQALLNAGYERDSLNLYKALALLQYTPQVGGGEHDIFTKPVTRRYPEELKTAIAFGYREISEAFSAKVQKRFPGKTFASHEAIATTYLGIKQMARAMKDCPRRHGSCQAAAMAKSAPDSLLGFKGYRGRQAIYETALKTWNGSAFVPVD